MSADFFIQLNNIRIAHKFDPSPPAQTQRQNIRMVLPAGIEYLGVGDLQLHVHLEGNLARGMDDVSGVEDVRIVEVLRHARVERVHGSVRSVVADAGHFVGFREFYRMRCKEDEILKSN